MNGLLFYWIGWIFWIVVTFLMNKGSSRTFLGCFIILIIIASDYWINVGAFQLNTAIIITILGSLVFFAKEKEWLLNSLKSLCLLLGYVGILFWEQVSPVWIFMPRELMIPLMGIIVLMLLSKKIVERGVIWCLGISAGEVLHGLIVSSYGFTPHVGDLEFFDFFFVGLGILLVIQGITELKIRIDHLIQLVEKQKKRWTHE